MHIATEPISRRRALALLVFTSPLAFGLASDNFSTAGRSTGMIRLAMLSFWHVHAQDYLQQAQKNPAAKITAVWDESPERGRTRAQALGVPFYERLNDLLAQANVDGVIVDTPTTLHRDVMVAAANAGKHIFTEKVLAPTLRESNEIVEAVKQANVKLMVSLPRLYSGSTLAVRQILERRLLGQLTQVRVRLTHDGALRTTQNPQGWLPPYFFDPLQTGGGAMIDLGSHPMYLTRLFLGLPESVNATYGYVTGRAVEDNAVAIRTILRARWVSPKPALSILSRLSPSKHTAPREAFSMARLKVYFIFAACRSAMHGSSGKTYLPISQELFNSGFSTFRTVQLLPRTSRSRSI